MDVKWKMKVINEHAIRVKFVWLNQSQYGEEKKNVLLLLLTQNYRLSFTESGSNKNC